MEGNIVFAGTRPFSEPGSVDENRLHVLKSDSMFSRSHLHPCSFDGLMSHVQTALSSYVQHAGMPARAPITSAHIRIFKKSNDSELYCDQSLFPTGVSRG